MKKVILENKQEKIYLSDLCNASHVGFIDKKGHKGYIACVGNDGYKVICIEQIYGYRRCNSAYGNGGASILEAIKNIEFCVKEAQIKELYVFNTRKELYKWLSE